MSGEPSMVHQKFKRFESGGKDYYLFAVQGTDGIELTVTDATSAWKGTVCQEDFHVKSKEANHADHEVQSREALFGSSTNGYEYELKPVAGKRGQAQLTWKKIIEKDTIKYQLGSTLLDSCDNSAVTLAAVFNGLIDTTESLHQQVAAVQLVNERLSKELSEAQQILENCASIKEDTEKNLYAKFVAVLNEKKAKIRRLKAQLDANLSGSAEAASAALDASPKRGTERRLSENDVEAARKHVNVEDTSKTKRDDEPTSDLDYSTDEEQQKPASKAECTTVSSSSSKRGEESRKNRTTSGSHSPLSFLMEDSASDEDGELPVVAKRGKTVSSCSESHSSKPTEHSCSERKEVGMRRIPCMLSTTGTTNTPTTSSDRQRQLEKTGTTKKDAQKHQSESSRSSNVDDLIGDMA